MLVRKIETDYKAMDSIAREEVGVILVLIIVYALILLISMSLQATRLLLELQRDLKEPCKEIEENCRLGLGKI